MVLKMLSEAPGVAGHEQAVRAIIRAEIEGLVDVIESDTIGNMIAIKNPDAPGPKIMFAAHMDEVGMIITGFERSGFLRFRKAGGIDDRVLLSKTVRVGKEQLPGVIGSKPIHLQEPRERQHPVRMRDMYIDIGAKNKEDAQKRVKLGDVVVFDTQYSEFGDGFVKGKAMDDRVGCAVLISLLKEQTSLPIYACFTVQEEIGLRGSAIAAHRVHPDMGVALEGTVSNELAEVEPEFHVTNLGAGPALTVMDAATIPNRKMLKELIRLAEHSELPYQFRRTTGGGTDAGRMSLAHTGVPTVGVSVPCRYIHAPVSVACQDDFKNTVKLLSLFLKSIEGGFRP